MERQRKLYAEGVTSKQSLDLAVQAYENAKADWEASTAARAAEQRQLAYYNVTAPFSGVVGDIPVHVGDYVSPQTLLTTVDENADLEAYIYIPTERAADIRMGLPVQIVTSTGELIENTKIYFISQQVDNASQGILVKAPVHGSLDKFRNAQLVKARVIWSTAPTPTVPVLAVTRIGGTVVRLRGGADRRRRDRREAARRYAGRHDRERLCGDQRPEARGQSDRFRDSVPYRRCAHSAHQLVQPDDSSL